MFVILYNIAATIVNHFASFIWSVFGLTVFMFIATWLLNGYPAAVGASLATIQLLICWINPVMAFFWVIYLLFAGLFTAVVNITVAILGMFDVSTREHVNHYPYIRNVFNKMGLLKMWYPGLEISEEHYAKGASTTRRGRYDD